MAQFGRKPSHAPGIALFLMLWILSLILVVPMFVGFRQSGYLDLAGSRLEGVEAAAGMAILGLIPVIMLALAIQRIHRFASDRRRGEPGE